MTRQQPSTLTSTILGQLRPPSPIQDCSRSQWSGSGVSTHLEGGEELGGQHGVRLELVQGRGERQG